MKQFEIGYVNLDPTVGAEMQKTRPCLVVSPDEMNDNLKTVIIAPLTSAYRNLPTRVELKATTQSGLKEDSYAALDQIKTIDKQRCGTPIGKITEAEAKNVSDILIEMFGY